MIGNKCDDLLFSVKSFSYIRETEREEERRREREREKGREREK